MQIYFAIALTIAAFVIWTMTLRIRFASTAVSQRMMPEEQFLLMNVAPLAGAWLVALLTPASDIIFYKGAIVMGMLLAVIGLAMRHSDFLPSYVAHAHLLITYTLYAYAFSSQTSGWPSPLSIILIVVAGLLYYWLYPTFREVQISAAIYTLLILLATWQALELALQQQHNWMGWAALAGMLIAVGATLLEAQASFRRFRPNWASFSPPLYFLAQIAIAWSIWG